MAVVLVLFVGDDVVHRWPWFLDPPAQTAVESNPSSPEPGFENLQPGTIESALPRRGVPIVGRVDKEIWLEDRNSTSAWTNNFFSNHPDNKGLPGGRLDE